VSTSAACSRFVICSSVWPAALESAKQPFKSTTWVAAMSVIIGRDGGDFARTRRLGPARLERLVRVEVERRGKIRPCLRILRRLYAALSDPAGVLAHRLGAFERIGWLIEDWDSAKEKLVHAEQRMLAVLDELVLTDLVCSIKGLSAVGPPRSWPGPVTCTASPAHAPWSNTPDSPRESGCRAPSLDVPA